MNENEEMEPHPEAERAAAIGELLATGEYLSVIVKCNNCAGGYSGLIHREAFESLTSSCIFCSADELIFTVV